MDIAKYSIILSFCRPAINPDRIRASQKLHKGYEDACGWRIMPILLKIDKRRISSGITIFNISGIRFLYPLYQLSINRNWLFLSWKLNIWEILSINVKIGMISKSYSFMNSKIKSKTSIDSYLSIPNNTEYKFWHLIDLNISPKNINSADSRRIQYSRISDRLISSTTAPGLIEMTQSFDSKISFNISKSFLKIVEITASPRSWSSIPNGQKLEKEIISLYWIIISSIEK